jgi:hypothetical protein
METIKLYFNNEQKDVRTKRTTMSLLAELRSLRSKHKEAFKYDEAMAEIVSSDADAIKSDKALIAKMIRMQTDTTRNDAYDAYVIDFAKIIVDASTLNAEDKKLFDSKTFWNDQDVIELQGFIDSFRTRLRA